MQVNRGTRFLGPPVRGGGRYLNNRKSLLPNRRASKLGGRPTRAGGGRGQVRASGR